MSFIRRLASRLYALTLLAFPEHHRTQYGDEMLDAFDKEIADRIRRNRTWHALRFIIAASLNAIVAGAGERRRGRRSGRAVAPGAIGRDLTCAVRSLAKARAFTLVCALSLGVGMGTVIAVVIIVRGVTGPPPGVNADALVELLITPVGSLRARTGGRPIETWSFPDFRDLRRPPPCSGMPIRPACLPMAIEGGAWRLHRLDCAGGHGRKAARPETPVRNDERRGRKLAGRGGRPCVEFDKGNVDSREIHGADPGLCQQDQP